MRKLLREFLFLKPSERRGLLLTAFLLLISISVRIWVDARPVKSREMDPTYLKKMDRIRIELAHLSSTSKSSKDQGEQNSARPHLSATRIDVKEKLHPIFFDPNKASYEELRDMGLGQYVSSNIVKYRIAGGVFQQASDLLKIYGMEDEVFDKLRPFVALTFPPGKSVIKEKPGKKLLDTLLFELNTADTIDLMRLPGIGPTYARRIVNYRKLLGGYFSREQLWEVYAMDTICFNALSAYTFIDSNFINKIDLNNADFKEIIGHPYIDKGMTYALLSYRDYSDSIEKIEELLDNQIFDKESFNRLRPYIIPGSRK